VWIRYCSNFGWWDHKWDHNKYSVLFTGLICTCQKFYIASEKQPSYYFVKLSKCDSEFWTHNAEEHDKTTRLVFAEDHTFSVCRRPHV
jgi:hypothetical protein